VLVYAYISSGPRSLYDVTYVVHRPCI